MTNIDSLTGDPISQSPEPNPNVVELAKDILRMAESGELTGSAGVGLTEEGGTCTFRAGYQECALIGRLEALKQRIIREWDD